VNSRLMEIFSVETTWASVKNHKLNFTSGFSNTNLHCVLMLVMCVELERICMHP
jgi:hypothetical protein